MLKSAFLASRAVLHTIRKSAKLGRDAACAVGTHLVVLLDMDSLFPMEIARAAAGIMAHVMCSACEGNEVATKGGCSLCRMDETTIRLAQVHVINYVIYSVVISIITREASRRLRYDRAQRLVRLVSLTRYPMAPLGGSSLQCLLLGGWHACTIRYDFPTQPK